MKRVKGRAQGKRSRKRGAVTAVKGVRQQQSMGKGRTVSQRSPHYSSLSPREKSSYDRTTNLIGDLRAGKGTYTELLRKHHLSPRTARKYAGQDLIAGSGGKPVRASKADRRVRDLMFPKSVGDVPTRIRGSRDATKLSEFFQDRYKLLSGKLKSGDFEAKWLGVRIAGEEVFADADAILQMADAGELKVEHLYASTGGAR